MITCFQIRIWIIYIHIYQVRTCFIYFFLVCGSYTLTSKRGRCRNILSIDSWLNRIDPGTNIISLPNAERGYVTKLKILLGGLFQYSIEQSPSLYLDYLIATVSWVFCPRVDHTPYPQSPKLPKPESYAEHTDFTTMDHLLALYHLNHLLSNHQKNLQREHIQRKLQREQLQDVIYGNVIK